MEPLSNSRRLCRTKRTDSFRCLFLFFYALLLNLRLLRSAEKLFKKSSLARISVISCNLHSFRRLNCISQWMFHEHAWPPLPGNYSEPYGTNFTLEFKNALCCLHAPEIKSCIHCMDPSWYIFYFYTFLFCTLHFKYFVFASLVLRKKTEIHKNLH